MKRIALAGVLLTTVAAWVGLAERPVAAGRREVRLNGHTFTLPVDFDIELAAGPPLVDRPINADFDEQGRLYVSDSSGSNDNVDVQLAKKPHRVLRLEDTDGDGRFDRRTVFADKLMFPEGMLWHDGAVYVAAPPSIWKLTDTDGDGVADQRSEWFQGKTLTRCANDLHGPYLGPDGWIYWCKGAFAKQTYERPGRPPFVTSAAHIFRARPDGTGIEPVMTGGMDNPVEIAFTPGGERIFSTTFLQFPSGGRRDGLIHAVYGGVYGKVHNVLDEHPWTGPAVLPVLSHLGPAAPTGLLRYESRAFGPEYQDNLFTAVFNLRKVTRHVLTPSGATFASRDEDFLVSDNHDFHPTDVLEDADGSLLVIDTGGWYKLCCPSSQLHKPDILGAIYRVRRKGAPRIEDPRGLKLAWAKLTPMELVGLLDDPRPAVRKRAVAALGAKGQAALPALAAAKSVEGRRNAVWAATRIDGPEARAAVRAALADADETVRQAAGHSVSLWRDTAALGALRDMLQAPAAHNRRVAAEALGRLGDKSVVPALLEAAGLPADRMLEHSLTYALIELADREGTASALKSPNALARRTALVALDQMVGGKLATETVAAELNAKNASLKETASWIAGRHPEWGGALAGYLRGRLSSPTSTAAERDELAGQLGRFAKAPAVQALLAERLRNPESSPEARRIVLRAMAQTGLKEVPDGWAVELIHSLSDAHGDVLGDAVAAARAVQVPKAREAAVRAALLTIGRGKAPDGVRLAALAAVRGSVPALDAPLFAFLRDRLERERPVVERALGADVLSRTMLSREQYLDLAEAMRVLAPMEVDRLLPAFERTTDEEVGLRLLAALKESPAKSGVRIDSVKPRLAKYSAKVRKDAEALYALLDADAGKQREKLEQLVAGLSGGDIRRGQAVFNSAKAACAACHAVGYVGGTIGPDLTRIGGIRTERDLLESIAFPSASFVRGYEPVVVTTKSGKLISGVIRAETPDEVVLALDATQEARIPRGEIEDMTPGKVSIMPAGLDQQLTPRELADLVAFMKACR